MHTIFILGISFFIGISLGSFLNAWIWRTRYAISILKGRSLCPSCNNTLQWKDNIPFVSFFLLKGKCRICTKSISWQYPLVELWLGIAFFGLVFYHYSIGNGTLDMVLLIRDSILVFFLTFVFVYDLLYKEIWDRVTTVPALIYIPLALIFGWQTWWSMLLGIVIGAGFFLLQFLISRGKWIGGGDVRLGFFMGVVLGFPQIFVALFLSYIAGAIGGLILMASGKANMASKMPFGTYLSVATVITFLWGNEMVSWYLGVVGW